MADTLGTFAEELDRLQKAADAYGRSRECVELFERSVNPPADATATAWRNLLVDSGKLAVARERARLAMLREIETEKRNRTVTCGDCKKPITAGEVHRCATYP